MALVATFFFISMMSLVGALYVPVQQAQTNLAVADFSSTSFLAYREALIDYLNANPGFTGVVADSSLTYPWGYQRDPRWTNVVSGTLYVYEVSPNSPNTTLLLERLYQKTDKSFMVGRNVSGMLISANGFSTGVTVPAAVPNGTILIAGM